MPYTTKIGIDPGVKNGVAVLADGKLKLWTTYGLSALFVELTVLIRRCDGDLLIRVEDARKRGGRPERAQGAGAVRAVCREIESYLRVMRKDYVFDYEFVPPVRNGTKLNAVIFEKITGYQGRSSEHSRDAAMLVWGSQ